jgi:molybdate-binding protein
MGLMVKRDNPLKIGSLNLVTSKARFVNRDIFRAPFDQLLAQQHQRRSARSRVHPCRRRSLSQVAWRTPPSASRQRRGSSRLDFVRLLTEDYFFVCRRAFLETEPMRRILDIMKGDAFTAP